MMELHKQSVAAVITLILLLSTGTTFAEFTQVQNGDLQTITSSPDSTEKPPSSISPPEESAGPARQPSNTTKSDSHGDINGTTEPDSSDTNRVTETQSDSEKQTTQTESANTTLSPNKGTSHSATEGIPVSVTKNDTKPHLITTENSVSSNDTNKNTTATKSDNIDTTTEFVPVTFHTTWMDRFLSTHHFEGQYMFNGVKYLFDFVARYQHPRDPKTLVTNFYDADGAVLEFNGTSADGHVIVFTLSTIYTPGVRFPLHQPLEITGSFQKADQPYFTGNVTKPINSSFAWFHMNKGLGVIETGETAGTRTAIVIIIPTSIAFLGICGTIAIVCWASKKGYLRGRHKSYRLFMNAQVSYESEAETIHI